MAIAYVENDLTRYMDQLLEERQTAARKEGIEIGAEMTEVRIAMRRFGVDFVRAHERDVKALSDLPALRVLARRLNDETVTAEEIKARLEAALQQQRDEAERAAMVATEKLLSEDDVQEEEWEAALSASAAD